MNSAEVAAQAKEQAESWDGEMGQTWAAQHARLDELIGPLGSRP